ncbi:hypothetical protein JAAARDRAFT_35005 [Jaapia argillacea MUCL 33604]|uniref:Protein kinase domain-containing protein n=1 Tax=Jaapia argillacea MUCL 33604 TaxID=933084 RepID=A0A067PTX2_9AGAM|nr:hypothetical protein JAAARDRAFT_35005 [Jaapia argillacea MUCL 33604]
MSHRALVENLDGKVRVHRTNFPYAIGQYADLYQGKLRPDELPVIVKIIRGVPVNDAARDEFREKAKSALAPWSSLHHKNVVPFLGVLYEIPYYISVVTPFYKHGTILAYIKGRPGDGLLPFIKGCAEGLRFLHSNGVIHTDIRASNVLIDDSGNARLTDIGLAPLLNSSSFTSANIAGPCRSQAPEVIQFESQDEDQSPFTEKSDVYAFAMLVVEIVTQERPFNHRKLDTVVIFDVIKGRRPHRPTSPPVVGQVWPVVEQCWSQEPTERPTMSEVCQVLKDIKTEQNF